jgi:hypothetical protein
LAAGWLTGAANVRAQDKTPSVDEIVNKTNQVAYYQGADGRAQVRMTIVDKGGAKRSREMTILRRDVPAEGKAKDDDTHMGDQKYYVYFHLPADVNKMVFLVHKKLKGEDERTLYLPALDLIKPISSADKRTSFVGSHFFYEDVSGRSIEDDTHELLKTTSSYYVLKNTPKDAKSVEFGHYEMWIHKATFLVTQMVYYDKQGKAYRKYQAVKVDKVGGFWTVLKAQMTDLTDNSYTVLEYSDVKYNVGLPDDIFTQRYLRKLPQEHLK